MRSFPRATTSRDFWYAMPMDGCIQNTRVKAVGGGWVVMRVLNDERKKVLHGQLTGFILIRR